MTRIFLPIQEEAFLLIHDSDSTTHYTSMHPLSFLFLGFFCSSSLASNLKMPHVCGTRTISTSAVCSLESSPQVRTTRVSPVSPEIK